MMSYCYERKEQCVDTGRIGSLVEWGFLGHHGPGEEGHKQGVEGEEGEVGDLSQAPLVSHQTQHQRVVQQLATLVVHLWAHWVCYDWATL